MGAREVLIKQALHLVAQLTRRYDEVMVAPRRGEELRDDSNVREQTELAGSRRSQAVRSRTRAFARRYHESIPLRCMASPLPFVVVAESMREL